MSAAPEAAPPRPLSSYALAAVAGLCLLLTGEIHPAALLAHAAALLASLRLRERPAPWQRAALVLNAGLAAIVAASLVLWLRGALAIVALAHFAHLAQALQLLDARPRRSDFLLVALALFQVLLAANLTDSVLFPPLLVLFLLAMTWTLVVHTLWSEALAHGEPWRADRALAPGLARTTLVAAAVSLLLAIAIFLVLPRVRSGALAAPGLLATPQAGFSDRIALGDLGRIRQDATVVLRVVTLSGSPPPREQAYWRGLAFDRFDGRHWSVTPPRRRIVARAADLGVTMPGSRRREARLAQRVLREPVAAGVLFAAGAPARVQGSFGRLEIDANGGLYAPESELDRVQYAVEMDVGGPDPSALLDDRAVAPPGAEGERYLALPELSEEVTALALRIVAGADRDAERVAAIERHLRTHGRYADQPPPERPGDPRSPIEVFLLEDTAGHCEYFASAMVVLARAIGIPARLVNGFAGGTENPLGGFVELTRSDAHAWVEVHFERAGWVRYDPTPIDARLRADAPDLLAQLRGLGSALEHWWYQHVVEFDRSHQMRALRSGWLAWQRWRASQRPREAPATPQEPRRDAKAARPLLPVAIVLAAGAALAAAWWRARRAWRRGGRLPPYYGEALRLLERHRGLVRAPATPAREFARQASRAMPPAAAAAFWSLTEAYLAQRFGGRRARAPRAELRTLRDTLRRR